MQNQKNLKILVECAVMVALATVLSIFKIYEAPLGGSVTLFSMVPLIIIGLRHGPFWGLSTAFVYSFTHFLFDASKLSGWGVAGAKNMLLCIFLDYIIAFTVLGLTGFFKPLAIKTKSRGKKIIFTSIATLFVCILRYISHVVVGIIVWYAITKAGNWNEYVHTVGAWMYSIVYNLQYMLPESIITLVAAPAVVTVLSVINKQKET
ncbi:MAG: energy-coupled thiamine transporter ThiT [Oscillospiraceae bacterium]|nr:energy-coupled thiamine transporter ThiT [Oscillospiraceae bacterium]